MGPKEAVAIAAAGVRLAVVYQNRQNQPADFSESKGEASGRQAYDYAENVIFQPGESAIYFSVDFDASEAVVRDNVIPFFEGVKKGFADAADGDPLYDIGVYGSGRTCRMLLERDLVKYTWITQSTGFAEYKKFLNSGKWNLKQLLPLPSLVCGIGGDPDEVNPDRPDFGSFELDLGSLGPAAPPPDAESAGGRFKVIANGGLRVRSGPGTSFDVTGMLSTGVEIKVLSRVGDWAMVDSTGDDTADGFVHSAFLKQI
jgi:hypothetical protein